MQIFMILAALLYSKKQGKSAEVLQMGVVFQHSFGEGQQFNILSPSEN